MATFAFAESGYRGTQDRRPDASNDYLNWRLTAALAFNFAAWLTIARLMGLNQ